MPTQETNILREWASNCYQDKPEYQLVRTICVRIGLENEIFVIGHAELCDLTTILSQALCLQYAVFRYYVVVSTWFSNLPIRTSYNGLVNGDFHAYEFLRVL